MLRGPCRPDAGMRRAPGCTEAALAADLAGRAGLGFDLGGVATAGGACTGRFFFGMVRTPEAATPR
jgi:hypothetical protein